MQNINTFNMNLIEWLPEKTSNNSNWQRHGEKEN